jgi:selenocysteine lyase/cysteine desulfurase
VAVEYLLHAGPAVVERYTQGLVDRLVARVDQDRFTLVSPAAGARRAALVVLRPTGRGDAEVLHGALTGAGIDAALREGAVRFSPHLYNTAGEIDRAAAALMEAADRMG